MKKTRAFHWRAGRRSGELHGPSIAWARATLRRRGVPNAVVRAAKHRGGGRKPAAAEVQLFSQQLAAMLGAGVPLASSLATLARHSPRPALQVMLGAVHNEVRAGVALSAALEKYPATFSPLYLSLVRAGELAGALAQTLDNLAVYLRKSIALRKKIKSALAYPAVVVTVAVTVVALMMVFVIPQFEAMFGHYETELPRSWNASRRPRRWPATRCSATRCCRCATASAAATVWKLPCAPRACSRRCSCRWCGPAKSRAS